MSTVTPFPIQPGRRMFQRILFLCLFGSLGLATDGFAPPDASAELPEPVRQAEADRIAAIAKAMPSAVSVFVPGGAGGGSGVLISPDGFALTNFHVTSPAGEYMRCGLSDGNIYDAVIVGIDPVGDLAMIQLLGRNDFPVAEIGDSMAARPGDWCMAIGNPFLLATDLQPTVTWGILSGVGRYQYPSGTLLEYGDCLQTDASINPGNSGGPLYDVSGRLLGIIGRCSFEKRSRVNVGVGYAISIRQAQNFLGYLHSGRIVDHATLGATVSTDPDAGVVVTNILESSDAYRRGLRYGSEILEVDGRPVVTANELQNVLATIPAQWRIKIAFEQDGETVETLVRLSSVHQQDELLEKMQAALPPPPPRPAPEKAPNDRDAEPSDDEPSDAPEQPKQRDPHGHPHGSADAGSDIPPVAKQRIQRRRGFANGYFNQLETDRVVNQLIRQSPTGQVQAEDVWVITGQTDQPRPQDVQIRIAVDRTALIVGDDSAELTTASDRYDAIDSGDYSALLVTLDSWRRILADGPARFGETYFMGTMPLAGERPLRDCLLGMRSDTETRWLSHPETGTLEAVEVFADRDTDPAELWLQYGDSQDENVPAVLDLRFGTDSVLRINVDSWTSAPDPKADAQSPAANASDDQKEDAS
uniref:S1C family serine protease n=1 Tax=Crateriforma conspicua TaxID=2527996 RepID=UPI0018C88772|nr:trypsin-like peptidase domain-containing protein [Crateriforma conspicua]